MSVFIGMLPCVSTTALMLSGGKIAERKMLGFLGDVTSLGQSGRPPKGKQLPDPANSLYAMLVPSRSTLF